MKTYRIVVSPMAADKIAEYGRYIAEIAGMPQTAVTWVRHVYDQIATLDSFPQRHALAEESAYFDFEVRRQVVGNYLVLYSIDEEGQVVHVVGFRHGHRLPRPDELPEERN